MLLEGVADVDPLNWAFYSYWNGLPKHGLVPHKSDFDPIAVPRLLPHLIIHEIQDRKRLHIRLCGTALVSRYGMDITGRDYLEFVPDGRKSQALAGMLAMTDHPCGALTRMNVRCTSGRIVQTEAIGLPLTQGDGKPPIVIFHSIEDKSFGFDGDPDDKMQHFGLRERIFVDIGNGIAPPIPGEVYADAVPAN